VRLERAKGIEPSYLRAAGGAAGTEAIPVVPVVIATRVPRRKQPQLTFALRGPGTSAVNSHASVPRRVLRVVVRRDTE